MDRLAAIYRQNSEGQEEMDMTSKLSPKVWGRWAIVLPAAMAASLAVLLGTVGWLVVSFGVGSNCTDHFSCGSGSCAPCAAAHQWVFAGGVGQWALVAVACVLLALGLWRASWRRPVALISWVVIPIALLWIVLSTVLAESSF